MFMTLGILLDITEYISLHLTKATDVKQYLFQYFNHVLFLQIFPLDNDMPIV